MGVPFTLKRLEFQFGASDTEKTISNPGFVGLTHMLALEVSNFTNDVTATLSIENTFGVEIYNSGAKARNADYAILAERILAGSEIFRVTLSGAPGGSGGTVRLTPYLY